MSLTKFTENMNVISSLDNKPTLTAEELKAKFDEDGGDIKTYLNDTLTVEVEQLVATEKSALQTAIANLKTELQNYVNSQILADNQSKYPIGKIIMSTSNTNPSTYLGFGTWQLWGSGKVPVGVDTLDTDFNEVEKTGGEKTHILTVGEMPSHGHGVGYDTRRNATGLGDSNSFPFGVGGSVRDPSIGTTSKGGGQAHNNLQPYITCYMWKRVS